MEAAALIAVGGYGRRELFPYSDVDLLVVTARNDLRQPLGIFFRTLWDAGLRVSHSVHTPDQLGSIDDSNIERSVSLLDRRFLAGDFQLFQRLRDASRERLMPLLARMTRQRHAKYGDTIYHLEPNIKEAPGTMRDIQVLRWLARLDGNVDAPPDSNLLYRIRVALHEMAARDQNVLTYSAQDECAPLLHFESPELLMRAYYRQAALIQRACLRRLEEAEGGRGGVLSAKRDRTSPHAAQSSVDLFQFVAQHGSPLARSADDCVWNLEKAAMSWTELRAILSLPHAAVSMRAMHSSGFLTKLFPELCGIESMVIRDFYHRYTVDEHTMVAIENAEALRTRDDRFGEIARETPDYPLLLLALLFHDSGKGSSSADHARASVEIARRSLLKIGASEREINLVLFLVQRHLDMSRLMLTRDLTDPGTAALLANNVQTIERLKLLTVLTHCDISAVNPEALTPWRATLLWQLYAVTAHHLTLSLGNEVAAEGMPARYALTHSPEEIAMHHGMEAEGQTMRLHCVEGAYRLTVVTPDQPALFARVAGALASFGMNIVRAEAFTNERKTAIEIYSFFDPMRTLQLNPTEFDRLRLLIGDAIAGRKNPEDMLRSRPLPRRAAAMRLPTQVSHENSASARATLFEITAEDRPGLLFDLARTFSDANCNIEVVLIDTEGHKAIDVFYVTQSGAPLNDDVARNLTRVLKRA